MATSLIILFFIALLIILFPWFILDLILEVIILIFITPAIIYNLIFFIGEKIYNKIFKKYDISHILLNKQEYLNIILNIDNNYTPVYEDNYFIIYERNDTNE